MNKTNRIELLKNIELFSSLTDDELHQINSKMVVKQFKKTETILYEEESSQFMYIILTGKVKVIKTTGVGKEVILAIHHSGKFFGEMSLIDGKTTPASVIATEDSLIAIISKNDFYSILFTQNKIFENLLKILSSRLRTSWDTIKLLTFNNATQRIKMLFFMLSEEYGKETAEGIILKIKLSHQEISDMTGMSRETVTRVIDKWQKEKDITILDDKFIRLNPSFKDRKKYINPSR